MKAHTPFPCVSECPEEMLGGLKACPLPDDNAAWMHVSCDGESVNGVRLPVHVREELRKLGLPLAAYTRGELEAIMAACTFDARLVDDPDGVNLLDKMTLTHHEKLEDAGATNFNPWRRAKPQHPLWKPERIHRMPHGRHHSPNQECDEDDHALCPV